MAPKKRPTSTYTVTLGHACPYVADVWQNDQHGEHTQLRAYCSLDADHEGEHVLGPWFHQNYVPFTISRRRNA